MLKTVTIIGADDSTDVDRMLEISRKYPFVEWAILYTPGQEGTVRHPQSKWRSAFIDSVRGTAVKRALHLGGSAVRDMLHSANKKLPYHSGFQRVQLDFDQARYSIDDLKRLAKKAGWSEFWDGSAQGIIVPVKTPSDTTHEVFAKNGCRDVQLLYTPEPENSPQKTTFPMLTPDFDCGYALNIDVPDIGSVLRAADEGARKLDYWVSFESRVTSTPLNLDQVERVLDACAMWQRQSCEGQPC